MSYRSTRQVVDDLLRHDRAIIVEDEVDPHLEIAEIQRRMYRGGGPAVLFTNVRRCGFPVVINLFGSVERARFLFRSTFESVRQAILWRTHPEDALKKPWRLWRAPCVAWHMRPKRVSTGPVLAKNCSASELPALTCWPADGGAFITLPQVLSQPPREHRLSSCNLGMYRVQLNGNAYLPNQECGLHYQIHRGIGVHHAQAIETGSPFPVSVTVGGSPAMTLAAVMPLPEGLSELLFAGALAGHRIPLVCSKEHAPIYADADFCVSGHVDPDHLKPEGPFGDHLGYYAKIHDFPVLKIDRVCHRAGAVWPMTVVGRPPQEDTTFGQLIHELTGPIIPTVLPGVHGVHAVDAAGVHPLLLAIGSERYTPYQRSDRPQELLTQACAILGQGQLSLAKYLFIVNRGDNPQLDIRDVGQFLQHFLSRANWQCDLHFHTRTTIDTLDYSGDGLNRGSKLVLAASGSSRYPLASELPSELTLPDSWRNPRVALPGVLVIEAEPFKSRAQLDRLYAECDLLSANHPLNAFRLIVIADDSEFTTRSLDNLLWVTFTRSNPASDVYGLGASIVDKHFGCSGSLVIDARIKPHHSDPLVEDPSVSARVDARAARGGSLSRWL